MAWRLETIFPSSVAKIDEIRSEQEEFRKTFTEKSAGSHSYGYTEIETYLTKIALWGQKLQNLKQLILNEAKDRLQLRTTETSSNENETRSQIDALNKEIDRLTKENEELKSKVDKLKSKGEKLKSKVEKLERELTDQNNSLEKRIRDVVAKKNTEFETALDSLCQRSSDLEKENADLRKMLKSKDSTLAVGLIGQMLETEIWKSVLPDVEPVRCQILATMEIELVKNCPEGNKGAQKRWDDLKLTLKWNEKRHCHALGILNQFIGTRMDGDPRFEDIDLEDARKQLKSGNYVSGPNIGLCEEILDMLLAVREINGK